MRNTHNCHVFTARIEHMISEVKRRLHALMKAPYCPETKFLPRLIHVR